MSASAVRRTDAPEPLVRRRHPDRASGVGPETHRGVAERDRRGRPGGRAAGDPPRRLRVGRGAVLRVGAGEGVGELVGARDAARRRPRRRAVAAPPGARRLRAAPRSSQAGFPAPTRWPATAYRSLTATLSPDEWSGLPSRGSSGSPTSRQIRGSNAGAGTATWAAVTCQPSSPRAHSWVCCPRPPRSSSVTATTSAWSGSITCTCVSTIASLWRSSATAAEGADLVVPDQQPGRVAAQGRPARARTAGRGRRGRCPSAPARRPRTRPSGRPGVVVTAAPGAKSSLRIRACTPLTTSTTCEMSKSVAALR